jgi:serine acetyltransferase
MTVKLAITFWSTADRVYPGKRVGDGAKIGLGSVVLANVRDGATMFGNPAKRIDNM